MGAGCVKVIGTPSRPTHLVREELAAIEYKHKIGFAICYKNLFESQVQNKLALKLSPSVAQLGTFFNGAEANFGGCCPEALAKIFTAAKPEDLGGASRLEAMKNGSPWQMQDQMWQLTGKKGRIVWTPRVGVVG